MQSQFELLTTQALKLTSDERESLVQLLLTSLAQEADIDEALASEVERRNADIESGKVKAIPIDEALALIRAGLK
ncbi:addiction module protein [Oxalobacteraceae bacterium OTU3CAMAD1]|nr:addiction module protein [Oxalobacteraceae bacterium OTU3CAMAD1]